MSVTLKILAKLQEANELLAEVKEMAGKLDIIVPYPTSNAMQIEITNLKESAYLIDRDLTAYCEGTPGTEDFINEITGTQGWN